MSIIRTDHNRENPYVVLSKIPLESREISWEAKGLWAHLMSKPNDWKISVDNLSKIYQGKGGGKKAIYTMLNNLIEAGYCERHQSLNEKGQFEEIEYVILEFKKCLPESLQRHADKGDAVLLEQPLLYIPSNEENQPPKPSKKKQKTESVGGSFNCLKEISISDKDKQRLSKDFSEDLVLKVIDYVTKPAFKRKGTLDKAIFYFCKNPDHMTDSEKEKQAKEQKAEDEKEEKIANRKHISTLIEKYCRTYLKSFNRDVTAVRWSNDYIEFSLENNQVKIYYRSESFRNQIFSNLRFQGIPIPEWLMDKLI